jgi:hypothetical protein
MTGGMDYQGIQRTGFFLAIFSSLSLSVSLSLLASANNWYQNSQSKATLEPSSVTHHYDTRLRRQQAAMASDAQRLLDEMSKRFDNIDSKLSQRLDVVVAKLDQRLLARDVLIDNRLADLDAKLDFRLASLSSANEARMSRLETATMSLDGWRPDMEGTVDDLRLHVSKLSKICERSVVSQPTDMTRVLAPTPSSAAARPPATSTLATRAQWEPRGTSIPG